MDEPPDPPLYLSPPSAPSAEVPPGTTKERFWQRSAFKSTVGAVVLFWLPTVRLLIVGGPMDLDLIADSTESSILAILAWAGVTSLDRNGLRKA